MRWRRRTDGVLDLILRLGDSAQPGTAVADIGATAYEIFRAARR